MMAVTKTGTDPNAIVLICLMIPVTSIVLNSKKEWEDVERIEKNDIKGTYIAWIVGFMFCITHWLHHLLNDTNCITFL